MFAVGAIQIYVVLLDLIFDSLQVNEIMQIIDYDGKNKSDQIKINQDKIKTILWSLLHLNFFRNWQQTLLSLNCEQKTTKIFI